MLFSHLFLKLFCCDPQRATTLAEMALYVKANAILPMAVDSGGKRSLLALGP